MDIFETREERYRTEVRGIRKSSVGNIFASSFLWKIENPLSVCNRSKYFAGKERQSGPT